MREPIRNMGPRPPSPFLERALTAFKNVADGFPNLAALQATGRVADGKQGTRGMWPGLGDNDLGRHRCSRRDWHCA
jgi:hypothetical protein